jgi:hypothetical protein
MRRTALIAAAALARPTAMAATAGPAMAGGRPLTTTLTGAAERPNPGDPDGVGSATLRVNPGQGEVCYTLKVSGIAPAAAAHIHVAPAGSAGPVVVHLNAPTDGTSSGCADISRALAKALIQTPENYYVNVHNAEFPGGALRGQLG